MKYCSEPNCPACDMHRFLTCLKEAGCPDGELIQITITALAHVVGNTVDIAMVEIPTEEGTVH